MKIVVLFFCTLMRKLSKDDFDKIYFEISLFEELNLIIHNNKLRHSLWADCVVKLITLLDVLAIFSLESGIRRTCKKR